MKELTYKHLYDYIQSTDTDNYGFITLGDDWKLQVSSNKSSVSINRCNDLYDQGFSNAIFLFDNNGGRLTLYGCPTEGCCEYSKGILIDSRETIESTKGLLIKMTVNGHMVYEVLRDLLTPYVLKGE